MNVPSVPILFVCTLFKQVSSSSDPDFTFEKLNVSDIKRSEYPKWAILRSSLMLGLTNIKSAYGNSITIESAYRSPKVQKAIDDDAIQKAKAAGHTPPPPSPDSRHLHGDAVDMAAGTVKKWDGISSAAENTAGVCIEPERDSTTGHVHADWRGECPLLWAQ